MNKKQVKGKPTVSPQEAIKTAQELITNQDLREETFHHAGNILSDSSGFIATVDCPKLRERLIRAQEVLQNEIADVLFARAKRRQPVRPSIQLGGVGY